MENSYSNSNNGGSVNSQDSIWQMKSAAAANGGLVSGVGNGVVGGVVPYDPMAGYAPTESDYPQHPHYMPQRVDDYRDAHNLSRQQFCEPFKPQKHIGQYRLLSHCYAATKATLA